ncbi:hypothetical protein BDV96DRAFT_580460 [Lophiotrema nucula]|uniref:Uncharacterized protein n=1 Tax=Lophiotrema nucula TaxID=690887 RepID=A0A6A5YZQ1_9PLEO|nr:hypothetical protein BDV96DRAFT_580460 [Lophiotrema nucula]
MTTRSSGMGSFQFHAALSLTVASHSTLRAQRSYRRTRQRISLDCWATTTTTRSSRMISLQFHNWCCSLFQPGGEQHHHVGHARGGRKEPQVRTDFTAVRRTHPEIKYYARWGTALPFIKGESIFRPAKDDHERRQLFEEYIVTLKEEVWNEGSPSTSRTITGATGSIFDQNSQAPASLTKHS